MSTSYTRTREQIARKVLRRYGVLASGASDNSADMEIVYEALDLRVKRHHLHGIFWRKVDEVGAGFSVAPVNTASVTADILFPIAMTVKNNSADDPVAIIGTLEYNTIEDKTQTGTPTRALWKGGAEFVLWPVPTASASATLIYQKISDDTTAGAQPDVDVSMVLDLQNMVTFDCADDFMQSDGKIARWAKEAEQAERNLRKLTVEHKDFTPVAVDEFDSRMPWTRSRSDYGN